MSRNRLSLVFATFLLIATLPLGAECAQPASRDAARSTGTSASAAKKAAPGGQAGGTPAPQGSVPAAKKTSSSIAKSSAQAKPSTQATSAATRTPATGPARWQVLAHGGARVPAFVVGSWQAMAGGSLQRRDFQEVSPPDIVAALGLATVAEPDSSGWFVSAGPHTIMKTTDEKTGFPTRSYESWANLGWAVGVTSGSVTAARVLWECNSDKPLAFADLVEKAVAEAPGAGAWIVAGQVEFALARGQALARSPVAGGINGSSDKKDPKRSWSEPVEDSGRSALVTVIVVSPDSPVGRQLIERFLPGEAPGGASGTSGPTHHVFLAHYALFLNTAPHMDTSHPFQALWPKALDGTRKAPQFETVRRVLDGTTVGRAYLSVWAIDSLIAYPIHENPDLVDPTQLDPTILADQGWARANAQFKEPIYDRPRLLLRRVVAEGIVRVNKRLVAKGFRLKLWDAYRPLFITQKLWKLLPGNSGTYLASPVLGSRHNRGAAVDCTLTDMEGRDVEMPSPYLTFDSRSNRGTGTSAAQSHVGVLTRAMEAEGFTTIQKEWWHYDAPGWMRYRVLNVPLWPAEGDAPVAPPMLPAEPPRVALPQASAGGGGAVEDLGAGSGENGTANGAAVLGCETAGIPRRENAGGSSAHPWMGGAAVLAGVGLFSAGATGFLRRRRDGA